MHDESPKNTPAGADWAGAWFDVLSKLAASVPPVGLDGVPPDVARQAQAAQLKWWNEYCSQLMRSPSFLEAMKQSMASASRSRKQANEFLGEMQHSLQGATREDIDHLSRSFRRHEEHASVALRDIRRRLADLSRRVTALANGRAEEREAAETTPAEPRPAPRRTRPAKPRTRKQR